MSEMTRLGLKRFAGEECRAEEYLTRGRRDTRPLSRAERDAIILLGLRTLETFTKSRVRRMGCSLPWFLARQNLLPHAADYLTGCARDPYNWTDAEVTKAHKWIAGELRQLNAKVRRDALQNRLDWIAEEAGLNNLDRQLLGVLIRAQTIEPYGWLLTYVSPNLHLPKDVHLLSLMVAVRTSRSEIQARLTASSPLITTALVEDVSDHEFTATPFAIGLSRLRTGSPEITKRAFHDGLVRALAEPPRTYTYESDESDELI